MCGDLDLDLDLSLSLDLASAALALGVGTADVSVHPTAPPLSVCHTHLPAKQDKPCLAAQGSSFLDS